MAKGGYIGDGNNKARKLKKAYVGDVNGRARKIKKIYVGDVNGKARLCWNSIRGIVAIATTGSSGQYVDKVWVSTDLKAPISIKLNDIQQFNRVSRVACSKDRFVLILPNNSSSDSGILYSDDGNMWTPVRGYFIVSSDNYPFNIKYFEEIDKFVAFWYQSIFISSDGITWAEKVITSGETRITDITYGDGYILIFEYLGYQTLYKISDGTTTQISSELGRVEMVAGAYGNGKFISYEYGKGFCVLDLNTRRWTLVSNILNTASIDGISMMFDNGMFLVGTILNGNYYSRDGITWTAYAPPKRIFRISYDGDKFLGTSDNAYGYSYDGINWTYVSIPDSQVISGGIAGN